MNRLILKFVALAVLLSGTNGVAGNLYGFNSLNFLAQADSVEKQQGEPEDSACCDKPLLITGGKILVPPDSQFSALNGSKRKRLLSPTGALFLSLAIPGGGQVYNGAYIKAILYGGTEAYLIKYVAWRWKWMNRYQTDFQNSDDEVYKAEKFALYEKMRDSRNLHLWLTGLVVFLSIFDAYVDAHLQDFDQTDKAFEVRLAPEDDKFSLSLVYNF